MNEKIIAICPKCMKRCNYEYEEITDGEGYYISIPYSNCCNVQVTFYDNIREVIVDILEDG